MVLPLLPVSHQRFGSIVILRGLVMGIMVLDHPRDFIHSEALKFESAECQGSRPSRYPTVESIDLADRRGMFTASMNHRLSGDAAAFSTARSGQRRSRRSLASLTT